MLIGEPSRRDVRLTRHFPTIWSLQGTPLLLPSTSTSRTRGAIAAEGSTTRTTADTSMPGTTSCLSQQIVSRRRLMASL